MDPNALDMQDVATAGYVGSVVYTTIEVLDTKKKGGLNSGFKSWLAPVLSFGFVAAIYVGIAFTTGQIFPLPKVITLAWQAYGHSQGQHNITSAMNGTSTSPPQIGQDNTTPLSQTDATHISDTIPPIIPNNPPQTVTGEQTL